MILELKNLPQEQQEEIQAFYNSSLENGTLLPPFEQFNEFGLKYPTEHLAEIGKFAIFFPVEMMINYVDKITKNYVDSNNTSFLNFFSESIKNSMRNFKDINTTSIGNLAYCYLHADSTLIKKAAKEQLDLIFSKMKEIVLQEAEEFRVKHWG